jgi:hypothetical protein
MQSFVKKHKLDESHSGGQSVFCLAKADSSVYVTESAGWLIIF